MGQNCLFQKVTKEPAYANHPLHVCDHADSRLYHGSKKLDLGPEICVKPSPCMRAKLLQSCPTFCDPMDCSLPGSSIHGIFQAKILECIAMPFSRGSSWPRDRTYVSYVSCFGRQVFFFFFNTRTTWEAQNRPWLDHIYKTLTRKVQRPAHDLS